MNKLEYGIFTKSWQPIVGCNMELPCAGRCWARKTIHRVVECQSTNHSKRSEFFRQFVDDDSRWTGKVGIDDAHLLDPLKWRKPQTVATGFHGDWGLLTNDSVRRISAIAALCRRHRFFTLTKRPQAIADSLLHVESLALIDDLAMLTLESLSDTWAYQYSAGPLQNLYLGTSISNQSEADERLPHLMRLAAAGWKTFVFIEPMLGPVQLGDTLKSLRWVVLGGESGPNSRPMHPDWARSVRDQCEDVRIPFWFKQWGDWLSGAQYEWSHHSADANDEGSRFQSMDWDGEKFFDSPCQWMDDPDENCVYRVGKKAAGHLLDGREHHELPAE